MANAVRERSRKHHSDNRAHYPHPINPRAFALISVTDTRRHADTPTRSRPRTRATHPHVFSYSYTYTHADIINLFCLRPQICKKFKNVPKEIHAEIFLGVAQMVRTGDGG